MASAARATFLALGPFEVAGAAGAVPLGGAKQRAVLAALTIEQGSVVPTFVLIDEVWGDDPPKSAAHAVEVYISRLRGILEPLGARIDRRGSGYVLEIDGAKLDTQLLTTLVGQAEGAVACGRPERVRTITTEALALWRGRPFADVELGPRGHAAVEQLIELRLRALDLRHGAELQLGGHAAIVGDLAALVHEYPYREALVGKLMTALYRSGRHVEALDRYANLRRRLDDDLGLWPSPELQELAARMVRHDPTLEQPRRVGLTSVTNEASPTRRRATLVIATTMSASLVAIVGFTGLAGSGTAVDDARRVALVLPEQPAESAFEESRANSRLVWTRRAFTERVARYKLDGKLITVDEVAPRRGDIDRLFNRIKNGGFELVLLPGDRASARLVAHRASGLPHVRFVFFDTSTADLSPTAKNVSAVQFDLEGPARLAGYASGLTAPRNGDGHAQADLLSVIAGVDDVDTERAIVGFRRGAREAQPGVEVRVDYVGSTSDPTPCEDAANEQIDAGADVIFVLAGQCGRGAEAVARARGVWVVGEDEFGYEAGPEPWMLANVWKDVQRGPADVLDAFVRGAIPEGSDLRLALADRYAVGTGLSSWVPASVQSRVMRLCSRIREQAESAAQ